MRLIVCGFTVMEEKHGMHGEDFCSTFGVERRGTNALKWDSLGEVFGEEDLIPLWVADMEFKSVPAVIDALKKRVEHGVFGYGKIPDSYYKAFFEWQKKRHGMVLRREEIRFATGVVGGLYATVNAYTRPEDSVVVCTPVYHPFSDAVINTGRKIAECELDNNGGIYTLNFDKFEKIIAVNKAKLFILCSPHNPVGRVWTGEELKKMFDICHNYGVIIVSDEIHQDFISPGCRFVPSSVVAGGRYKDRLITLNSGSKTFNLAGLIHSHTIIYDEKLRGIYDDYIKTIGLPEANIMGLTAMETAYRYGESWLEGLNAVIQKNYAYIKAEFAAKAPGIIISPLEGTYLTWLDLRACVKPGKTAEFIQKKCRLAVDVGEWFIDRGGEGFIRINLATLPKFIELAAQNIIANLKNT
jgi:cystathionine beta-lyase